MIHKIQRNKIRQRKHRRVRMRLHGTAERPRLCVFRSNAQIYAQLIDDEKHATLMAVSSLDKNLRSELGNGGNAKAAAAVGKAIAERAKAAGIEEVVFDRGGYIYHGRVAALAEAAREAGLKF